MYRRVPLGNPQRRNTGGVPPDPGAFAHRAQDHPHGHPHNPGHQRNPPVQQDRQRGDNERQEHPHQPRSVDNPTPTSVEGTVATMRLRSRLQDLESVLGLYDIFKARKCDGRNGLIKWNIHLYDYLQAIYEALFSVEGALQVVKNHRETTGATEKTADKVVAVWRNWQNNFQSAFTKEQISHFGKLRGSERELSLGRRAADVGQYLTRALRACVYRLRGHVNWKWWADKDVKKVEEELLAETSALRNS